LPILPGTLVNGKVCYGLFCSTRQQGCLSGKLAPDIKNSSKYRVDILQSRAVGAYRHAQGRPPVNLTGHDKGDAARLELVGDVLVQPVYARLELLLVLPRLVDLQTPCQGIIAEECGPQQPRPWGWGTSSSCRGS
jgi:hypothetical protein